MRRSDYFLDLIRLYAETIAFAAGFSVLTPSFASASTPSIALPVNIAIPRGYHRIYLPCCAAPTTFFAAWKLGNAPGAPTISVLEQTVDDPVGIRDYIAQTRAGAGRIKA